MTTAARRRPKKELKDPGTTIRVAVYTRKSVEQGLEQEFNSLDHQRQVVESYIQSHAAEGWVALAERYDDGGFSGGTRERPAFQRLLGDVEAGKIDAVAVYKLDRLTRGGTLECLRTIEFFNAHGVNFVSVTERIDTSGPMGKFMLSLFAALAELERRKISEWTADKVRAARRNGRWTGGNPILGYDALEKKLIVNPQEAEKVRAIFKLYLVSGSTLAVAEELNHRGLRMKPRKTKNGEMPAGSFTKNSVGRLLTNATYIGKTSHAGELFDGKHEPIVDQTTWDAVQDLLQAQRREKRPRVRSRWGMLLQGLVRCAVCGAGMTTHYAVRGHKRYTYYTCLTGQKQGAAACRGSRVAAGRLEAAVVARVRAIGGDPELIGEALRAVGREVKHLRPDLEERLRKLEDERERFQGEARNLVSALGKGNGDVLIHQRLGELHAAIANAEVEAHEARAELEALDGRVIDPEDLRRAIESFDPIWPELFPAERARVLRLLIERVAFDGRTREVTVQFRPRGVRALAGEGEERTKLA